MLAPYEFYVSMVATNGAQFNWNNPDGLTINADTPLTLRGTCRSSGGVSSTIGPITICLLYTSDAADE